MQEKRRFASWCIVWAALLPLTAAVRVPPASAGSEGSQSSGAGHPIGLSISAGDGTFGVDEPVVLTASVTNRADTSCELIESPEVTLQIREITRDDAPVFPSFDLVSYNDGIGQSLRRTSREVTPDESLRFQLVSHPSPDGLALGTVVPRRGDGGVISLWPVAEPGTYELEASYAVPSVPGIERCTGGSNVASVEFTVGPSAASGGDETNGVPIWLILVVGIGCAAAVLMFVLVRRHRRAGATTAIVLLLALAMPTLPGMTDRAEAKIASHLGGDANREVQECLNDIRQEDPWTMMPDLDSPDLDPGVQIVGTMDSRSDQFNEIDHPFYTNGIGETSTVGLTIRFDTTVEESEFVFEDGVAWDNCAALFHELVHVMLFLTDESSEDECKNAPILADEFKATLGENAFRRAIGLEERTVYGGVEIPATCGEDEEYDEDEEEDEGKDEGRGGEGEGAGGTGTGTGAGGGGSEGEGAGGSGTGTGAGGGGPEGEGAGGTGTGTGAGGGAGRPGRDSGGSYGEPHLTTHDGMYYDFQAVGELVLVESDDGQIQIQVRQAPFGESRSVSVNSAVAARVGDTRLSFEIDDGGDISVRRNGEPSVPDERGSIDLGQGASLVRRESFDDTYGPDGYTIVWPDGSKLWIDGMSMVSDLGLRLYVDLAESRAGAVSGLLGDFDGNAANDLVMRGGEAIELEGSAPPPSEVLYQQFGESWRLDAAESLFDYDEGSSTEDFTDRTFPEEDASVDLLPEESRSNADEICRALGVSDPPLLDACILDVATTGQGAYAVNSSEVQRVREPDIATEQEPEDGTTAPEGPPVTALDSGDIAPGDTVEGRVDTAGTMAVHRFEASSGDVAFFEADPDCEPDGTELAWSVQRVENIGTPYGVLGAQASVCADIGRIRFPEDGEYAVIVDGGPNEHTGPYRFTWVETPRDSAIPLELGTEISGSLEPGERHGYVFDAESGVEYSFLASESCEGPLGYQIQTIEQFEEGYWGGAHPSVCDDQEGITLETRRYAVVITRYTTSEAAEYSFVFE